MTTARTLESSLGAFRTAFDARFGQDRSWLTLLRASAFDKFVAAGLPTRMTEGWRHLDLSALEELEIRPAPPDATPISATELRAALESAVGPLADSTLDRLETLRLVFVDGWFAPGLSATETLAATPWIRPFASSSPFHDSSRHPSLQPHRSELEPYLTARAPVLDTPFAVLNTALFQDGVVMRVPRGARVPFVVHLVHVTTSRATVSHPRHVLVVESGASVEVVSDHVSTVPKALVRGSAATDRDGETSLSATSSTDRSDSSRSQDSQPDAAPRRIYVSNPVLQIHLEDNAEMHLYKLVREHEQTYHLGVTSVIQGRDSRFTAFSLVRGGRTVRQDLECRQEGEGAESVLHGLNVLHGTQFADDHTTMVHTQPHGSSREFYKSVLDDRAEGVFHGKVIVEQTAVRTNAQQSSRNLLLSADALMNTEPQLEISTDDVKCGHGATIGQLDAEALFYLRSRGLEEGAARALLTQAFASDIVAAIQEETVRELVQGYLTFPLCRRPGRTAHRSES